MALTLSEGRRRLASGRRYVSMEQGERRVVSTGTTDSTRDTMRKKSIAPFLASNRQSSRNRSPKPSFTASYVEPSALANEQPHEADSALLDTVSDVDMEFTNQISPATAARVEKAKVFFELAHEHRRLLSHLPPVRHPDRRPSSQAPEAMQKAYNPLQYVRNRKLRVWEKTPIDGEMQGWHDIQKVRAWVDAVVSSNAQTHHDADECIRLPPLDQQADEKDQDDQDDVPDDMKKATSPRLPDQFHPNQIRPRSDWVTHPADMIADAYWLEQGMNKSKIQDRDNNLIYPPNTHFKFSGWRNKTPVDIPTILQQPSPPVSEYEEPESQPPSALPELPTFKSAKHKHNGRHYSRRRDRLKDTLQIKDGSSSRERSKMRRKLFPDSSDTDFSDTSSSPDDAALERGRKRLRRRKNKSHNSDDVSPSNVNSTNIKHKGSAHPHPAAESSPGSSAPNSKRSSVDHSALNKLFVRDSVKKISSHPQSRIRNGKSPSASSRKGPVRSSLDNEHPPRMSADYDTTTAPSSPAGVEWPSIAINLSPPPSRSTSPMRKQRSSLLHPFHRKHKDTDNVSTTDFAHVIPSQPGSDVEKQSDKHSEPSQDSRGTSPMTRGLSPLSKNRMHTTQPEDLAPQSSNEHRPSIASKASTRSTVPTGADHSRIRGIFKGGRIAELVGHEVSRVGDFIWKRDPPGPYRHRVSTSDTSLRSYPDFDHEQEPHVNGALLKTPPPPVTRSRSSTISSTKSDRLSPVQTRTSPPSNEKPKYNNPNLPSFTSPFQKDREEQGRKQALLTPGAAVGLMSPDQSGHSTDEHQTASRSPRMRMALPKLDTAKANTPIEASRRQSYGFSQALDLSRSRDASNLLNTAIGPVAMLTDLHPTRSAGELMLEDQGGQGQEQSEPAHITWRDIRRAEALLYSSTVKAREIGRRAEDPQTHMPKFLIDSFAPENLNLHSIKALRVKRREQHVVAAKNITETLEKYSTSFNYKLHSFTAALAPTLHRQLQMLEDSVENTLTPQVRITADAAGELSIKLTTASTLAVKGLNDSIDAAFRRRKRGPFRAVRKIWFALIEWGVVGLLWFIWAIVSFFQAIFCTFRFINKTTRWLLWID
ncbi:uncharacterized protein A1O9_01154 [Exophiala aquamarina CBS 119918]|uniref:Uncharacterized protein n=1 Tax=Exophiala aquamarina CBS 119918 TaxID=1182545 RepID=A0A072PTV1_9EURO|nr:uncharacterized protein A1O9_01154 [Exophiala aquamarina CBS 119918]KEF63177.1 hypothetical protein A1O9_01154 [Exophiala aquamarina CBS 119918]